MKTAIIFPGQGTQAIGMAKDFVDKYSEAKDIFMLANETLNRDLYKLVMEGDIDELNITRNTQPAIITAEMAMLEVFKKHINIGDVTAGLSLGEYSSLIFSKALKFTDALPLVEKRGELMLAGGKGRMAAIIGYDREKLIDVCQKLTAEGDYVVPANFNSMEQIVISLSAKKAKAKKGKGNKRSALLKLIMPYFGGDRGKQMEEAVDKGQPEKLRKLIQEVADEVAKEVKAKK